MPSLRAPGAPSGGQGSLKPWWVTTQPMGNEVRSAVRLTRPGLPGAMAIGCLSAREGPPMIHANFQPGSGGTSLGAATDFGKKKRILPAGQTIVLDPVWLSVEPNGYEALERYGDVVAAAGPKPLRTGANALWCSWYPIRMGITEEIVLAEAAVAAGVRAFPVWRSTPADERAKIIELAGDLLEARRFELNALLMEALKTREA